MENKNHNNQSFNSEELPLREVLLRIPKLICFLLSKWKALIASAFLGALVGFLYPYIRPVTYTAACSFVLEEPDKAGTLSQYAGLAAIAGINLGGGSGNGIFEGDNILELYKSRTMLEKTLLSRGVFDGGEDLLVNRYIKINGLFEDMQKKDSLTFLSFEIPREKFTRKHDSLMTEIIKDINKKYLLVEKSERKLSIITVKVKSKDEQFAKVFTDNVVETVNKFYVATKTKKADRNFSLLQRQADSVRSVLNSFIGSTASALDANPNANAALQTLRVPSQRRQVDVQTNSAIYAEIVKNLEIAKMSLLQEAPLIQIIDQPIYPLATDRIGRAKGIVLGGFFLVLMAVFAILLKKFIKKV